MSIPDTYFNVIFHTEMKIYMLNACSDTSLIIVQRYTISGQIRCQIINSPIDRTMRAGKFISLLQSAKKSIKLLKLAFVVNMLIQFSITL